MALSREEVLKIAKLSKLEFEETEIEKFQSELNDILKYVDILNEIDTDTTEPLVYINSDINNFKENVSSESISLEKALLNAPEKIDSTIVVPKVVGE